MAARLRVVVWKRHVVSCLLCIFGFTSGNKNGERTCLLFPAVSVTSKTENYVGGSGLATF